MAEDKTKFGKAHYKVIADQDYEVSQLTQKYGISSAKARRLIERFGRERIRAALQALSRATNPLLPDDD